MTGIEFERAKVMLGGALEIAFFIGAQGGGQKIMIAGIVGLMPQRGRQMTPRELVSAIFEMDFRQGRLRFFRRFRGQLAKATQANQKSHGVARSADRLIAPSQRENAFDQIQGRRHIAASMQPGNGCPACAHDNHRGDWGKRNRHGFVSRLGV